MSQRIQSVHRSELLKGICFGAVLYTVYSSTLELVINSTILDITSQFQTQKSDGATQGTQIGILGYADGHAPKDKFQGRNIQEESMAIQGLELCLENMNTWMNSNRIKMNNVKTEFTCLRLRQQLTKCVTQEISVLETEVKRME